MAAIEIPADYFRVNEGRFSALVQPFNEALSGVHADVAAAGAALDVSSRTDAAAALADMDADAGIIANAIGDEHGDVSGTPTGDVLGNYGNADDLTATADGARPPDDPTGPPHSRIVVPPPPLPHGTPPPDTPVDGTGTPRDPGAPTGPIGVPRNPGPTKPGTGGEGGDGGGDGPQLNALPPRATGDDAAAATAAPEPPAANVAPPSGNDAAVTRGELIELLSNMDFTINVQV